MIMRKVFLGLCAVLMCFSFSSCELMDKLGIGSSPAKKIAKLQEKVEDEGDDYKKADWEAFVDEYLQIAEDFIFSDPTEEDYEEFKDAVTDLISACSDVDSKSAKAFDKVMTKVSKSKRYKAIDKKLKAMAKKFDNKDKDEDEDDDEDDDDNDDENDEVYPDDDFDDDASEEDE